MDRDHRSNGNVMYSCKRRSSALDGFVGKRQKQIMIYSTEETTGKIIGMEAGPDHVHPLVEAYPQPLIHRLVKLRSRLPTLRTNS